MHSIYKLSGNRQQQLTLQQVRQLINTPQTTIKRMIYELQNQTQRFSIEINHLNNNLDDSNETNNNQEINHRFMALLSFDLFQAFNQRLQNFIRQNQYQIPYIQEQFNLNNNSFVSLNSYQNSQLDPELYEMNRLLNLSSLSSLSQVQQNLNENTVNDVRNNWPPNLQQIQQQNNFHQEDQIRVPPGGGNDNIRQRRGNVNGQPPYLTSKLDQRTQAYKFYAKNTQDLSYYAFDLPQKLKKIVTMRPKSKFFIALPILISLVTLIVILCTFGILRINSSIKFSSLNQTISFNQKNVLRFSDASILVTHKSEGKLLNQNQNYQRLLRVPPIFIRFQISLLDQLEIFFNSSVDFNQAIQMQTQVPKIRYDYQGKQRQNFSKLFRRRQRRGLSSGLKFNFCHSLRRIFEYRKITQSQQKRLHLLQQKIYEQNLVSDKFLSKHRNIIDYGITLGIQLNKASLLFNYNTKTSKYTREYYIYQLKSIIKSSSLQSPQLSKQFYDEQYYQPSYDHYQSISSQFITDRSKQSCIQQSRQKDIEIFAKEKHQNEQLTSDQSVKRSFSIIMETFHKFIHQFHQIFKFFVRFVAQVQVFKNQSLRQAIIILDQIRKQSSGYYQNWKVSLNIDNHVYHDYSSQNIDYLQIHC